MKRAKSLFNQIISYENVRLAWLKARRHKTSKNVVKNFSKNVNKNLLIVQKNLKSKPAILNSKFLNLLLQSSKLLFYR